MKQNKMLKTLRNKSKINVSDFSYFSSPSENHLKQVPTVKKTNALYITLNAIYHHDVLMLSMRFANRSMRDIFLAALGTHETVSIANESMIFFPMEKEKNQQLAIIFPSIIIKKTFMRMLNISVEKRIFSDAADCRLVINDRRIQDIASRFSITIVCPFLSDYFLVRYIACLLAQGQRSEKSYFSKDLLPAELLLKILSYVPSSTTIDNDTIERVVAESISQPRNSLHPN